MCVSTILNLQYFEHALKNFVKVKAVQMLNKSALMTLTGSLGFAPNALGCSGLLTTLSTRRRRHLTSGEEVGSGKVGTCCAIGEGLIFLSVRFTFAFILRDSLSHIEPS